MPATFLPAGDAVARITDGATLAVTGSGGGLLEPDTLLAAIEARFLATGHPRDLTVLHAQGIGDRNARGLNRLAHPGLVRCVIGAHWTWSPRMQALAEAEEIEAYAIPGNVLSLLLRETGAGRPGLWTRVGLETFVDPRLEGGALNRRAATPLAQLRHEAGQEWLFFPRLPVDVALVRGSLADARGNIALDREPADLDVYALSLAARNSGGQVFAQVRAKQENSIRPARRVRLPAPLVDVVLVDPTQRQSYGGDYSPAFSGETDEPPSPAPPNDSRDERRIIARRAFRELAGGETVCFGFGIPDGVAAEIARRGLGDRFHTLIDHGVHGGRLLSGDLFGIAAGPEAIVSTTDQADFIHGGGVDIAFLGFGEIDALGNVNASKLGGRPVGPGAFMDIAQSCRKLVLCGTFEGSGLRCRAADGRLVIESPGRTVKFVDRVAQVTYPGTWPALTGQAVVIVTERAVFHLDRNGLELVEVAPGIDPRRDILDRLPFEPRVAQRFAVMAPEIFT